MKPDRKLAKARSRMISHQPFWGTLALKFPLRKVSSVPTLGTDGREIMYNEDFVDKLPFKYLVTAVGHEVGHIMFLHSTRVGSRDQLLWNLAGDIAINYLLVESGFEPIPGWAYDSRFDNMSAEEIYRTLYKENPPQQGAWSLEDLKGDGDDDNKADGSGKCCGGLEKMKSDDGTGRAPSKHEMDAMEEDMKQTIAQAAQAAKMAGNLPSGLERFISDIVNPRVNWKEKIHRFVDNNARNDFSWLRPSRRYLWQPMWLPSLQRPCLEHVVCVVDTSGSITQEILSQFGAEMSAVLATVELGKLTVMYCDTQVGDRIQEFEQNDLPMKLNPQGGGGTMFSPAFKYVEEKGMDPTVLIYLTDLWCSDYPADAPEYPVLWACSDESYKSYDKGPPFGEVVMLE